MATLEKYYQDGLIQKQNHPTKNLIIWNYTPKVQYDKLWDDVTIRCRGLITDIDGKIIVQPFKKFFNYEEVVEKIPTKNDYVYIQEKMDGSLGILFNYDNDWIMTTRGSFTSEQSIRGLEIVKKKYNNLSSFEPSVAYLVEIIYPENRIVVDYKNEKIVFLSVTLNRSFKWDESREDELHWTTSNNIFHSNGIEKVDIVETKQYFKFSNELYNELKNKNEENKEGYVLRFFPSNFRVKIKFDEYVRLHRILTNVSNRDVWEYLKDNKSFDDLLEKVPDEFNNWIKETVKDLTTRFENIDEDYNNIFNSISSINRKEFAEKAKQYPHPSILFAMYDGKPTHNIIWKLIYPSYSKPFKNNEEEN